MGLAAAAGRDAEICPVPNSLLLTSRLWSHLPAVLSLEERLVHTSTSFCTRHFSSSCLVCNLSGTGKPPSHLRTVVMTRCYWSHLAPSPVIPDAPLSHLLCLPPRTHPWGTEIYPQPKLLSGTEKCAQLIFMGLVNMSWEESSWLSNN